MRDVRNVPVLIWYAADDKDCLPSHAEWLVTALGVTEHRVFSGMGHVSAAFVDHVEFLDNTLAHLAGAAYTHTSFHVIHTTSHTTHLQKYSN